MGGGRLDGCKTDDKSENDGDLTLDKLTSHHRRGWLYASNFNRHITRIMDTGPYSFGRMLA